MGSKSYTEQLKEAKAEAKQSGKRIQKVFDKAGFVQEFPDFKRDPRAAFTPDQFIIDVTPMEAITVAELRKRCETCGSEFALMKMHQVEGLDENIIVSVLRQDLDAIDGKVITSVETTTPAPRPKPTKKKQ